MSEERKQFIAQGFDTVAPGYEHPSLNFFPQTAERMVEYLGLRPQHQLLDVCTGTGLVALKAAEKLQAGKVTGIDLSAGMLQQARNNASRKNINNAEFIQMDLDDLQFPDHSFDVVTSSFGLFFLEDMTQGLDNMRRMVRPGGQLAISSFAGTAFSPMADMFIQSYESLGREIPPLSWKRLATEELIREQFRAVNLSRLKVYHEPLGYQMTDPQMWWDVVWNAGWRSFINLLSEQEQREFRQQHLSEISRYLGDRGAWFNTEVLIAVADV